MTKKFEDLPGIVTRKNYFNIDPRRIRVAEGFNARTDFGDLDELVASIAAGGVREPLKVRRAGDEIYLVAGERRLRAALIAIEGGAPIKALPCMLVDRHTNEQDHTVEMLLENSHRKEFRPIEEAEALGRLQRWGWELDRIALETGFSVAKVRDRLGLLEASPLARKALEEGSVSVAAVREALREPDRGKQDEVIAAAVKDAATSNGRGKAKAKATRETVIKANGRQVEPRRRVLPFKQLVLTEKEMNKTLKGFDGGKERRARLLGRIEGLAIAMGRSVETL